MSTSSPSTQVRLAKPRKLSMGMEMQKSIVETELKALSGSDSRIDTTDSGNAHALLGSKNQLSGSQTPPNLQELPPKPSVETVNQFKRNMAVQSSLSNLTSSGGPSTPLATNTPLPQVNTSTKPRTSLSGRIASGGRSPDSINAPQVSMNAPLGSKAGTSMQDAKRSVDQLAKHFERTLTEEVAGVGTGVNKPSMMQRPRAGAPTKRATVDSGSPSYAAQHTIASDGGPKSANIVSGKIQSLHDKFTSVDMQGLKFYDDPQNMSPGAVARRRYETEISAAEAQDKMDPSKVALSRSRAINVKKRTSTSMQGGKKSDGSAATSAIMLPALLKRHTLGNYTNIASALKTETVQKKAKGLYRLFKYVAIAADELYFFYDNWSNSVAACSSSQDGVSEDTENHAEEFPFDVAQSIWRDILGATNELIGLLPETFKVQNLRRVQTEIEVFAKQDQSVDTFPRKERDIEACKVLLKCRKICSSVVAVTVAIINDYLSQNSMLTIMSVPNWKIECVSNENMKYWQSQNGLEMHEIDKEKDLNENNEGLKRTYSRIVNRHNTIFVKESQKNEVLSFVKPQYLQGKYSEVRHVPAKMPRKFSSSGRLSFDVIGRQIIPIDFFDIDTLAYRMHFLNHEHRNYIGTNEKFGELAISIKRELCVNDIANAEEAEKELYQYRVLFRCKSYLGQMVHMLIPEADVLPPAKVSIFGNKKVEDATEKAATSDKVWKAIFAQIHPKLEYSKMKRVDVEDAAANEMISKIEKSMLQLDEHRTAFNYKFGLLYVKDGQSNETQWFNNTEVSDSYLKFCEILGETIDLKGHTGFTGGLDPKNGNTGEQSIYTRWRYNPKLQIALPPQEVWAEMQQNDQDLSFEIMYHVSTMLPFTPTDEQQIQRKRHIGNDLVSLVFFDSNDIAIESSLDSLQKIHASSWAVKTPFDPRCIRGQFLHVYIVVQEVLVESSIIANFKESGSDNSFVKAYRVYGTSNIEVPNFEPSLSDPPLYVVQTAEDRKAFRDFLLAKLINAENAAFQASKFKQLNTRTYIGLIETVIKEFYDGDVKQKSLSRRKTSVAIDGNPVMRKPSTLSSNFDDSTHSGTRSSLGSRSNGPLRGSIAEKEVVKDNISTMLVSRMSSPRKPSGVFAPPDAQELKQESSSGIKNTNPASSSKNGSLSQAAGNRNESQLKHEVVHSVEFKDTSDVKLVVAGSEDIDKLTDIRALKSLHATEPAISMEDSESQPVLQLKQQSPVLQVNGDLQNVLDSLDHALLETPAQVTNTSPLSQAQTLVNDDMSANQTLRDRTQSSPAAILRKPVAKSAIARLNDDDDDSSVDDLLNSSKIKRKGTPSQQLIDFLATEPPPKPTMLAAESSTPRIGSRNFIAGLIRKSAHTSAEDVA